MQFYIHSCTILTLVLEICIVPPQKQGTAFTKDTDSSWTGSAKKKKKWSAPAGYRSYSSSSSTFSSSKSSKTKSSKHYKTYSWSDSKSNKTYKLGTARDSRALEDKWHGSNAWPPTICNTYSPSSQGSTDVPSTYPPSTIIPSSIMVSERSFFFLNVCVFL